MSGRGSATRMDRLQNHVTGSLLLNVIENTAKLDKSTSSSSVLSEELNSLKTKVTQISGTANTALEKAQEAKDAVDSVSDAASTAKEAATEANAAKEAAQKAAESLTNVVLKDPTGPQTISNDLTLSNGVLTIGSSSTNKTLLTVNGQTKLDGSVTIGTFPNTTDLTLVNGRITAGGVTIGKTHSDDANLNVDGSIKSGDITVGTSTTPANLEVYGTITTSANSTTDPSITTERTLTINEQGIKLTEGENNILQLDKSPEDIARVWSENKSLELKSNNKLLLEGSNINLDSIQINVDADMYIGRADDETSKEVKVYGNITSTGTIKSNTITAVNTSIALNSPTQVNADMTIGTSTDNPKKKLTVNGNIESTGTITAGTIDTNSITATSGTITTTSNITMEKAEGDGSVMPTLQAPKIITETISSTSQPNNPSISLGVSNGTKTVTIDGKTIIGTLASPASLEVHGPIRAEDFSTTSEVSLSGLADNAVLKEPTEEADQAINGNLIATDFRCGNISLKDLAGDAVLKNPLGPQEISNNLTLNGGLTIGTGVVYATRLMVNGNIESKGDVTIGTLADKADLTVYGNTIELNGVVTADNIAAKNIKSTGTITIGTSSSGADEANEADLTVNGKTQSNGDVTIGTSSTPASLEVNGQITAGNVTIGSSTTGVDDAVLTVKRQTESDVGVTIGTSTVGSDLTVYGDIIAGEITATDFKYGDESLLTKLNGAVLKNPTDGAEQTITGKLKATDFTAGGVSLSSLANAVFKNPSGVADQIIMGRLIATDFTTGGSVSLSGLAGDAVLKNSSNAQTIHSDVTIGTSSTGAALLTVNGPITSTGNVTIGEGSTANLSVSGTITSNGNVTIGTDSTDVLLEVNGGITSKGNVTIGEGSAADLTVNGQITAGNVTIGKSPNATDANEADLIVNGKIQSNGSVTIGEGSTEADLSVNGKIILGDLTISYNPETGDVTFRDDTHSKSLVLQLQGP